MFKLNVTQHLITILEKVLNGKKLEIINIIQARAY